jgi:hypothetical protein
LYPVIKKYLCLIYMTCSLNPKTLGGKRRKQRGGNSGATAWGSCISGGMNQVAAAGRGNEIAFAPVGGCIKGGSRRRRRTNRRSSKKGGSIIGDIAIPAAFVWANNAYGSRSKSGKSRTSKRRSSRRR